MIISFEIELELAEKTKLLLDLENQLLGKFKEDLEFVEKENKKRNGSE